MGSYRRELVLDLPERQSAFLWGPRKAGKSTLLAERFLDSARFDLLETRTALDFTREPWLFTERVLALDGNRRARPIVVDEVQKVPALLDEVHRLIEQHGLAFVLCGSRAAPRWGHRRGAVARLSGSTLGQRAHLTTRVIRDPDRPTRRPWSRRRPRATRRILAAGLAHENDRPESRSRNGASDATGRPRSVTITPSPRAARRTDSPVFLCRSRMPIRSMCTDVSLSAT